MRSPYHGVRAVRSQQARLINRIKEKYPQIANSIDTIQFDWYKIRNAAEHGGDSDTTEVFIYDEIGGPCSDLQAQTFVQELNEIKTDNIVCRINSPGGSLFDGIAIYNALVQHPANVTTRVDAIAASAASIVAMAGSNVEMMLGSQLMIHDAMCQEMGNAREMRETADFLDKQSENIAMVYAAKSGKNDTAYWRNLMIDETWMFGQEAIDFGLASSLYSGSQAPREVTAGDEALPSVENEDDGELVALEAMMAFNHIAAGNTRKYKHTSRNFAGTPGKRLSLSPDDIDMAALAAQW